jgi:spore maturation protein CgeB
MTLDIVIFGLSITSSWGNGHATTYRALAKGLAQRGHKVTFLERDVSWYRDHRDLAEPDYCRVELYDRLKDVALRFGPKVADANLVILGSYVPDGAMIGDWITSHARGVTAFYDIDTPVTLAKLADGPTDYISASLIPRFDLYLSFTGGPVLQEIEDLFGSPRARALHCAVDLDSHAPVDVAPRWTLGYLGTYSADRQPTLERLLLQPAARLPREAFAVAGAQYPSGINWSSNVELIAHVPPADHSAFYCAQRYTLNVTRADMVAAGYSPSVRLFEAAACEVPVISDSWPGLETFFVPGQEILIAEHAGDVVQLIESVPDEKRRDIAAAARKRVLQSHTPAHRAREIESYYREARSAVRTRRNVACLV